MITGTWRRLQFSGGLKIQQNLVAVDFFVACHLTNIRTCVNGGNIITSKYGTSPPTVEEYIGHFH